MIKLIKNLIEIHHKDEDSGNRPPRLSEPLVVHKDWGYEIWMANDEENDYCGKILHVNRGHCFSMHFHKDKHETFYILKGEVELRTINTETAEVHTIVLQEGDSYVIDRLLPHQVTAIDDTDVIESSTFHKDEDSYRVWRGNKITTCSTSTEP